MQQNKLGEQKQFRRFGLFSLICIFLSSSLFAESFADFNRKQNDNFNKYLEKDDIAFSKYLKSQWQEYIAKQSPPLYKKPKPKSILSTKETKVKSIGPRVNIKIPKTKEQVTVVEKPKILKKAVKGIYINYFGQELKFIVDDSIRNIHFYPQNQEGIVKVFKHLASSEYEEIIREIHRVKKSLNLNDWGVYQIVIHLSKALYPLADNRKLFSWFVFNKLGYEVKIGLGKQHVQLMHYSKKNIYSTPRYTFGDKQYYVISAYDKALPERIYTYKQHYPNANKAIDLGLEELPMFQEDLETKTVSFKQFGKVYSSTFSYDKNLIDFLATYPQADYETYFNSPLSSETYNQIARDIKKEINTKRSSEAINFVLNFVQKAFSYERDQEQFGREKVMFASETLYYDKSDCEDRAILFAYLVKKLFKISVIGVKYKDHMATALYIPMKGDSVKSGGKKFIIADPTYINANIGQSMPKYKSVIPQVFIVLSKER